MMKQPPCFNAQIKFICLKNDRFRVVIGLFDEPAKPFDSGARNISSSYGLIIICRQ